MILERAYEGALKAHVVPITQKAEASQEQMPPSKPVFALRPPRHCVQSQVQAQPRQRAQLLYC